jgi:hypothetical protein
MTNPGSVPSVNTLADTAKTGSELFIDGKAVAVPDGELLLEAILREKQIPHVCYHSPLMGPIRSCDTSLVEVNGKLERACGMEVSPGLQVVTTSTSSSRTIWAYATLQPEAQCISVARHCPTSCHRWAKVNCHTEPENLPNAVFRFSVVCPMMVYPFFVISAC